jgi:hypothetical protein
MSYEHAGPNWHIANLIPRKYNYWTNSDFLTVHYYNGNSFRLFPFQHQGALSASNPLYTARVVCNRLSNPEKGETSGIGEDLSGRNGNLFSQRPNGIGAGLLRSACDIAQCSSGS